MNAHTVYSPYKGVWSNDKAEAVITDSICIFYFKADSTMQAVLEIPSAGMIYRDKQLRQSGSRRRLCRMGSDGGTAPICL